MIFVDATYLPINREGESARIWKEILEDIKDRGVEEVGIVVEDGLKRLREVLERYLVVRGFSIVWCMR